jgi:hypothetical protein
MTMICSGIRSAHAVYAVSLRDAITYDSMKLTVFWLAQCTTWLTHSRQAYRLLHFVPAFQVTGKRAM